MEYINMKNNGVVETIDQFNTYKVALQMCIEYNISDTYNIYYVSNRSTKQWRITK